MIKNLIPASVKACGQVRIRLTTPSFEEIRMMKIVGRMMEEKAEKQSEAILTANISLSPITA